MVRHIVIAALRNMAANRLISAIAILGLAAGIATALLMGMALRSQMTFDHFIPGHERTYRMFWKMVPQMQCGAGEPSAYEPCSVWEGTKRELLHDPAIEGVAQLFRAGTRKIQHGAITGREPVFWADADFFDVVPLPVVHGNLKDAASPGDIVIDRSTARRYFGRDDAVGQSLAIDGRPAIVRAVTEDLPPIATTIESGIFVRYDRCRDFRAGCGSTRLYLRLKAGATFTAAQATAAMWRLPGMKGQEKRRDMDGNANLPVVAITMSQPVTHVLRRVVISELVMQDWKVRSTGQEGRDDDQDR